MACSKSDSSAPRWVAMSESHDCCAESGTLWEAHPAQSIIPIISASRITARLSRFRTLVNRITAQSISSARQTRGRIAGFAVALGFIPPDPFVEILNVHHFTAAAGDDRELGRGDHRPDLPLGEPQVF